MRNCIISPFEMLQNELENERLSCELLQEKLADAEINVKYYYNLWNEVEEELKDLRKSFKARIDMHNQDMAKLEKYEQGIKVNGVIYSYGSLLDTILIDSKELNGMNEQKVKVIVIKEDV